jgi:nitroreductase
MKAIYTRRSIRKYTSEPVPRDALRDFVKAGMNAPSAGNQQPWHFVAITERSLLDAVPSFHPHAKMLREAPAAIVVCGDPSLEKHKGYWVQDCSAATQNILLEITDRGYGGVWLGVYPRTDRVEGMRALLGIPETVVPFSIIAVGRPAEEREPKNVFRPERMHENRWAG